MDTTLTVYARMDTMLTIYTKMDTLLTLCAKMDTMLKMLPKMDTMLTDRVHQQGGHVGSCVQLLHHAVTAAKTSPAAVAAVAAVHDPGGTADSGAASAPEWTGPVCKY